MAKRRVLIVDDSKTAQVRLRKMLDRFDIEVDTVFSAEEALGYLSYRQPVVIFLDHHMEGMDGLAALKIIKSNPATALIPVIMYTSEQGDVYVGQARALGALDIISKDVIQYSSLEKVLGSLNIGPKQTVVEKKVAKVEPKVTRIEPQSMPDKAEIEHEVAAAPVIAMAESRLDAVAKNTQDSDLEKVRLQISKLFEIHIAKVRQEIEDSTKFLFRRLTKEIQDKNKPQPAQSETPPENEDEIMEEIEAAEQAEKEAVRSSSGSGVILATVLLSAAFVCYQLYLNVESQNHLAHKFDELAKQSAHQDKVLRNKVDQIVISPPPSNEAPQGVDGRVLLDALGWAVNVNTQTPFGRLALSDDRIYVIGELLSLLKAANFEGGIYVDIHAGNFCVVEGDAGEWVLPDPATKVRDCVFMADQIKEVKADDQVSVGFLNYMHSTPVLTKGSIDLNLSSQNYSVLRHTYPAITEQLTAGEWNIIAQKNNRIEFSFAED